ncbi:MAG: adenylate kinase [Synergistaceae bacterium]|nr:adenylate kinase [Synergistaceae bacterium]
MRLVLLGAPGSGKGTQADLLKAKYNCVHISTGDILRKNLREKTELGLRAEAFMNKGELVPDDLIIDMVGEKLRNDGAAGGFLMDGFPRTVPQAEAFDKILNEMECPLDAVLLIKVDEEIIVRRLTNRRTCRACGKILNLLSAGAGTGKCPACGGEIYQRDDDCEQVIRNRLDVYREQTEPLVAWYESRGLLRVIEALEHYTPEDTFKGAEAALGL